MIAPAIGSPSDGIRSVVGLRWDSPLTQSCRLHESPLLLAIRLDKREMQAKVHRKPKERQGAAKGGVMKGGVYKRKRTQTNARKRRQTQMSCSKRRHAGKRAQMQTNADRREQTQNQRISPLFTHPLLRQPEDHPKYLLRQNFPSEGKMGDFSLRGKIFPLRDNFPLKIAFTFPQNDQFSHEIKSLRKRSFYGARENL